MKRLFAPDGGVGFDGRQVDSRPAHDDHDDRLSSSRTDRSVHHSLLGAWEEQSRLVVPLGFLRSVHADEEQDGIGRGDLEGGEKTGKQSEKAVER